MFNPKATAILVHKGVTFESDKKIADPGGRFIIVTGQLLNKPVILANVYSPNWDDCNFINLFFSTIPDIINPQLIIGGGLQLCALLLSGPLIIQSLPFQNCCSYEYFYKSVWNG